MPGHLTVLYVLLETIQLLDLLLVLDVLLEVFHHYPVLQIAIHVRQAPFQLLVRLRVVCALLDGFL